jgi:hypothetical protein
MTLTADLSNLPLSQRQSVLSKLRDDDAAQMALAKIRQAKVAQLYRNSVGPGSTKEGIGPISMAIDPYFASYFRRLHGESIFQDDQFVEYLKRRGEWFHVPEAGTRIQVGYTAQRNVRQRKSYQ